jgi:phosphopantothenoylcysteine decarboxylase/phosphopantothenate--cysteine ligase
VLLLRAKNAATPRFPVVQYTFETADELAELLKKYSPSYSLCFQTAAISDFSLASKQKGKLSSSRKISLDLIPREKMLVLIKKFNPHLKVIAFKAEWNIKEDELYSIASRKMKQFDLEAVIANDVSKKGQGFEADTNEVFIVLKSGEKKKFGLTTKRELAGQIIDYFVRKGHIL